MPFVVDDLDEENWEIRETFAFFGRAIYMASVLEVGLAHVLMHGQFMMRERDKYIAAGGKSFDRKAYEASFDAYMKDQFAQTMGNLIKRVNSFAGFDDALKARIEDAKKRRDFLTHHYWRERSVEFFTPDGKAGMRAELSSDADVFGQLDRDVEAAAKTMREKLGIDDSAVDAYVQRQTERLKSGLTWDDEPPELN